MGPTGPGRPDTIDRPYSRPNILRLAGVTLADYRPVEDVLDSKLIDDSGPEFRGARGDDGPPDDGEFRAGGAFPRGADEDALPFDRIPHRFTSLEEWPLRTNLRCWECDCTFDDRPKFVPTYMRESEQGRPEVGVRGNFCTFNCAQRWIESRLAGKPDQLWRAARLLCIVYFLFTGFRVGRILPAPDKTDRRQYGGDLDDDAFWARLRALDPVAGLRDHTPGSVVPERNRSTLVPERFKSPPAPLALRPAMALALLRGTADGAELAAPLGNGRNVWGVCSASCSGLSAEGAGVATGLGPSTGNRASPAGGDASSAPGAPLGAGAPSAPEPATTGAGPATEAIPLAADVLADLLGGDWALSLSDGAGPCEPSTGDVAPTEAAAPRSDLLAIETE